MQKDGVQYNENQDKANILNEYFSSVFTSNEHPEEHPNPSLGPSLYSTMPDLEISEAGVSHLLSDLDPSKSNGPDKLPTRLLKLLSNEISPSLTLLFTASLHQGTVLQDWKKAPHCLKKVKDQTQQIIVLYPLLNCVCSKILKYIIHTNIMKYLLNHHILSDVQFGFRENHSAELQLINATHDYLNNRSQTGVILLDCSKAFDKVPHHLETRTLWNTRKSTKLDR